MNKDNRLYNNPGRSTIKPLMIGDVCAHCQFAESFCWESSLGGGWGFGEWDDETDLSNRFEIACPLSGYNLCFPWVQKETVKCSIFRDEKKTRLYLAEAVHTVTLIRDIGLWYNINSSLHLRYKSVHKAFCVFTKKQYHVTRSRDTITTLAIGRLTRKWWDGYFGEFPRTWWSGRGAQYSAEMGDRMRINPLDNDDMFRNLYIMYVILGFTLTAISFDTDIELILFQSCQDLSMLLSILSGLWNYCRFWVYAPLININKSWINLPSTYHNRQVYLL